MARFPYALVRDAIESELNLRAMSLVYTTLLSLVPFIALSFSILKGFGVHQRVQPLLYNFLAPLGQRGVELTDQVIGWVDNVKGVALGSVGLTLLLVTVISMVSKVEESFNYVWQVERTRSLARRFSEYLSVIVIAPLLIASAVGVLGSVASSAVVERLAQISVLGFDLGTISKLTPHVLITLAFTFVYGLIPNTRVNVLAALVGGITGGVLWGTVGMLFASFVRSADRYEAIYASFAIPLLALIWLYISWLILLLGAKCSFYFQHPEFLRTGRAQVHMTNSLRERLALAVMYLVGDRFRHDDAGWTINSLASHVGVPSYTLAEVVDQLLEAQLLARSDEGVLMPARDTECIALAEVLAAARGGGRTTAALPRVDAVLEELDRAADGTLADRSLRDLVEGIGRRPQVAAASKLEDTDPLIRSN